MFSQAQISSLAKTLVLALMISTLVAIFFGPGLNYDFFFDDYNSLMNDQGQVNALIKSPAQSLNNLRAQPLRPDRNLTWLSFAASYKISEMSPAGFRSINLILHALCSFLVYLLLALFISRNNKLREPSPAKVISICWPALIGTLFFICHPLALNTVLYVSQRFGALASFFYLLGFFAWLKGRYNQAEGSSSWQPWLWYLVTGLAFLSALHSKEMAITLPPTIIVYELYAGKLRFTSRKKILIFCGLIGLTAGLFCFFAYKIGLFNQTWINIGFRSKRLWSPGIQFLSEARAFFHYWQMLFLPLPQTLSLHHEFFPSPKFLDSASLTAIIGHIFLLGSAWKMRWRYPVIGFGILWFYLVLGPPYLFLPQKELLVEYKTYLAAPGAALMICGLLDAIKNKLFLAKKILAGRLIYIIFGCWLILLTSVTWQRRPIFQNQLTLWSDVLQKYPASRRALNNRAVAHLKNKEPEKALNDLDTLLKNHPDYARGFENRGRLRLYLKDYRGAVADLQKTLNLLPDEPELKNTINQITELKKLAQRAVQKENIR